MDILKNLLFGIPVLEWIGYLASAFVLVSLSMSSLVKLRWLNLGIMNFLIVCANIYNLYKIYAAKDKFVAIAVKDNPELMNHFLTYYAKDIANFFPDFKLMPQQKGFFVLRNMAVAGIFIGRVEGDKMRIDLDYVLPTYRDFKVGHYLYPHLNTLLTPLHITQVFCETSTMLEYMQKMGFEKRQEGNRVIMFKDLK